MGRATGPCQDAVLAAGAAHGHAAPGGHRHGQGQPRGAAGAGPELGWAVPGTPAPVCVAAGPLTGAEQGAQWAPPGVSCLLGCCRGGVSSVLGGHAWGARLPGGLSPVSRDRTGALGQLRGQCLWRARRQTHGHWGHSRAGGGQLSLLCKAQLSPSSCRAQSPQGFRVGARRGPGKLSCTVSVHVSAPGGGCSPPAFRP